MTLSNNDFYLVLAALELKELNHMLSTCSVCLREQKGMKADSLPNEEKGSDQSETTVLVSELLALLRDSVILVIYHCLDILYCYSHVT